MTYEKKSFSPGKKQNEREGKVGKVGVHRKISYHYISYGDNKI
jgi:hypothetical protein